MAKRSHGFAAVVATVCIATSTSSFLLVELFGSRGAIATVKHLMVRPGLFILVPAIALAGITGFVLSKKRKGRLLEAKKKRMPTLGVNGAVVLLPGAMVLERMAASGIFDTKFYLLQGLELVAGRVNLSLTGLNIQDGPRLGGKRPAG